MGLKFNFSLKGVYPNFDLLHVNAVMDGTAPFFPHLESDFSSGYLEDALLEFSERSKRRRLLLYSDHDQTNGLNDLVKVILDFYFK